MKTRLWTPVLILILIASSAKTQTPPPPQQPRQPNQPTESTHIQGPDGTEGWTLDSPIPDQPGQKYPFTLVIARKGRVLRKIDGDPFVWQWIFWDNGRQVAYEAGPLHFGMQCILADVRTGKPLESYDCWRGIPDNAPAWLEALEKAH
ncbi:MAG: hypothetical protein ABR987_03215 [Terracidiphilus sp.]|jgi:hypothetical protein